MKIAISFGGFLPVPPLRGGATEKIWTQLARRLAVCGHKILAFSRRWPEQPNDEVVTGVRHVRLTGWNHYPRRWQNLLVDLRWSLAVRRALPADHLVISHNVTLPWLLTSLPPQHRAPVVVTLGRMPKGQVKFYRRVDRVYAFSQSVRDVALHQCPALESKLRVIPNAIDFHTLAAPRLTDSGVAPVRIGYVGRLHPEKGLDLLAAAMRRLAADASMPAWTLSIIGPSAVSEGGGGEAWLQTLRASFPLDAPSHRIEILPPIWDTHALAAHYRTLDVFCYPSLADNGETFGVSALEAMAAGAVPVLSDLACFLDFAKSNENALFFSRCAPDAAERLATQIATLLRDTQLRRAMSANGRRSAARFDYAMVAAELENDLVTLR